MNKDLYKIQSYYWKDSIKKSFLCDTTGKPISDLFLGVLFENITAIILKRTGINLCSDKNVVIPGFVKKFVPQPNINYLKTTISVIHHGHDFNVYWESIDEYKTIYPYDENFEKHKIHFWIDNLKFTKLKDQRFGSPKFLKIDFARFNFKIILENLNSSYLYFLITLNNEKDLDKNVAQIQKAFDTVIKKSQKLTSSTGIVHRHEYLTIKAKTLKCIIDLGSADEIIIYKILEELNLFDIKEVLISSMQ